MSLPRVPVWSTATGPSESVVEESPTPGTAYSLDPAAQSEPLGSDVPPSLVTTEVWTKRLSRSDAQRKFAGNQRGSITLTKSVHAIDAKVYFRRTLFINESWVRESTATGEPLETALVSFDTWFLGRHLGTLDLEVSFAPNREAAQANYTSLLHLGPLADFIARTDVTGKWLELLRLSDGTFSLRIVDTQPL